EILPVNNVDEQCDYYIVSNEYIELPYPWKLLVPEKRGFNNKDFNRYYKLNPHILFNKYNASLYIDGNIALLDEIYQWSEEQLTDSGFAIFSHPERDNIFDEGEICSFIGTDFFWKIKYQLSKYKDEGFDYKELFEANILLRNHNDPQVIELMSAWWLEYKNERNSKRDQLALPYVLWKKKYHIRNMGHSDARFGHKYFKYMSHASNRHNTINTKIKKIVNRTIGKILYGI
ncbi:glycosyltransferase domain-containing protein, partial [Enterobacter kobei]